ncbi:MAG: hypothetical protein IPJ65_37295 [Archangiaceae bacterium]|nr:hypothetical protein [Archangiaceae bacterium]
MRIIGSLLAVTLTGCGGPVEAEADGAAAEAAETAETALSASKAKVRVSTSRQSAKARRAYDVSSTNTLFFIAEARGCTRHLAFEVMEPGGNVWQRSEAACEARVVASMPISGTWIQQFSMTGTWTVKVFVDDAPNPAGSARFLLR